MKIRTLNKHTAKIMSYQGSRPFLICKGKIQAGGEPGGDEDLYDYHARAISGTLHCLRLSH